MNEAHASDELLASYVMGSSLGAEEEAFERHLRVCVACAEKLAMEARLEEQLFAIAAATRDVVPRETPAQWRPNAAAALSMLSELDGAPEAAPPAPEPAVTSEDVWQFVRSEPKRSRWPWAVLAVSLTACAIGIAGIGIVAYALFVRPSPPMYAPQLEEPHPPVTIFVPATQPASPPPSATRPQPIVIAKLEKAKKRAPKEDNVEPSPFSSKSDAKSDGFDDLLSGKKAKLDVKPILSRDDVLAAVRAHASSITRCADTAARNGVELPAKLVVKWVIKPSGTTEDGELTNAELKGTPLAACVAAAVRKWKFPEFQSGTIPVTFPFPVSQ